MCKDCIHNKSCDFPECVNPEAFEPPVETHELRCLVCDWIWTSNDPVTEQCPQCKVETDIYVEEILSD